MKMEIGLQLKLQQTLKLAPQIIQSIQILQMPVQELKDLVAKELEENPTLEEASAPATEEEGAPPQAGAPEAAPAPQAAGREYERVDNLENELREYEFYQNAPPRRAAGDDGSDVKMEAMKNTAARPVTLQDYLHQQLHMLNPAPLMWEIGEAIIYNIDDSGYLQYPLEDIAEAMDVPVVLCDVEEALAIIQSFEPPGVAARDLRECLLLQMDAGRGGHQGARMLVAEHLEEIKENRIPRIAKETGMAIEEINEALSFIRTLNPHPGYLFGGVESGHIVPDVMVDYIDGEYHITLENEYIPQLQINPLYRRILESDRSDPDAREYVRKKLESARWLINSIEQRRSTVYRIARKIVEIQGEFLDQGVQHLKPLKMQAVADEIGVHVSTVSRAIANKYIQTRRGIFEMKYFFTGGTACGGGAMESRTSVRQRVWDVIRNEDKASPLSDEEVAEKLKELGLDVARRTVTKYRKAMAIPSSRQRKEYH